jgi:hypothetical protein
MTTPTDSTSNVGHDTSFTHHVNINHINYAKENHGEYEIDNPLAQENAKGKEYVEPKPIKIVRKKYAIGGHVGDNGIEYNDDSNAFPEQSFHSQYILAKRLGDDEQVHYKHSAPHKKHVAISKDLDSMLLELTMKKAK